MSDLASLRREYAEGGLSETDAPDEPFVLFTRWFEDVVASGMHDPNAMVVSTVGADGRPSSRLVLLKGLDSGFVFFTNHESRKAREVLAHPDVALLFPWHPVGRQVRVEGRAVMVSDEESDTYFATRPRGSQLGAWASPQSSVVPDRATLEADYLAATERFTEEVPRPPHWGGFRVTPVVVEFWQGRPDRMHDRLRYTRPSPSDPSWQRDRLAP